MELEPTISLQETILDLNLTPHAYKFQINQI